MTVKPSLWLLLALLLAIGFFFYRVIEPFVLVLFIAVILAVLFDPLNEWLVVHLKGFRRTAAALTTVIVLLLVLIPIVATVLMAGAQLMEAGQQVVSSISIDKPAEEAIEDTIQEVEKTSLGSAAQRIYLRLPPGQREQIRASAARVAEATSSELYDKTRGFLSNMFSAAVAGSIMLLAFYYFLADREIFLRELHRVLPLEIREEQILSGKFQSVCRGVVMGTVVAGIVQAILSGIAYAIIGVPQVWLLIVLTMFFSFVPFLGAAAVWSVVSLGLLINQDYVAGIGLALYGAAVISTADNLVRAYIIGDMARLHPLIALVSAIGALKLVGLWGIFIGPMVAAFSFALLNLVQERLEPTPNGASEVTNQM